MAWVKLDDQFFINPKARAAGLEGRAMFLAGLCYCSANRTQGLIITEAVPLVAVMADVDPSAVDALCRENLWRSRPEGYEVVDYGSRHHCARAPFDTSSRRPKLRPSLRAAVIERDEGVCGLCGGPVPPDDIHLDHIIPRSLGGPDEFANLQVTHSACNMRKGNRV